MPTSHCLWDLTSPWRLSQKPGGTGGRQGERAASWLTGSPPVSPLLKEAVDPASRQVPASVDQFQVWGASHLESPRNSLPVHPLSEKSQNPRVLLGLWEAWHSLISNTDTLRRPRNIPQTGQRRHSTFSQQEPQSGNNTGEMSTPRRQRAEWGTHTYG